MFYEQIYKIGMKKRNPSLMDYYKFLKQSERWSLAELQDYQLKKCKEFLQFAYIHSDFYRQEFDRVGFRPDLMTSLVDMKRIPVIDKNVLLNENEHIHTDYKFRKLFFSETSGTSGQVLKFYRNEEWDSHNRAAMFRGYSWYGVSPWEKNGYFWGYNIDKSKRLKTKLLDLLQHRFRLFSYEDEEIRRFTEKLKNASYLNGYSSMIYEVAKMVNTLGFGGQFHLKMIKGTSEKIYDRYQEEVQQAFGSKIISEYGAAESGLIAFECPECGNMHINMENVIVEECEGEIIVTNLLSRSFPIIRYKLGDSIKLAPPNFQCPCGRKHPVLTDVLGRVGKKIIGKEKVYPSLTFYYVFKNLALESGVNVNYQALQKEKGKICLKIEQSSLEHPELLSKELEKYFKDDIDFEILYGQTLHSKDKKMKDFITEID